MKTKSNLSPTMVKTSPFVESPWGLKTRNKPRGRPSASGRKKVAEMEARRVPVLMRGSLTGVPMATPRRTIKTQRRMDIPIGIPGAEIRLPTLPQVRFGWRFLSALLSFALIALIYFLWTAPLFKVQTPNIQGLQLVSAKEVSIELDIQDQPIFTLDPQAISEQLIAQFPEFRSVKVSLQLPNRVNILVEERKPIFLWKQGERTLLVDAEGVAFPLRREDAKLPKLIIEAEDFPSPLAAQAQNELRKPLLPVDVVSGILSISAMIPDGAVLFYDRERGLGWHDPRGWAVYVGALKDLSLKMKIYELMVKKIKKQEEQKPVLISIEYVHAPYYRVER